MYYAAHFLHDSAWVASLRQRYQKTPVSDILADAPQVQAMGFATITGVNPVYGLYSAIIATIVGAFASSSALMTIRPTNALRRWICSGAKMSLFTPVNSGATEEALARAEAWLRQDTGDSTDRPPAL